MNLRSRKKAAKELDEPTRSVSAAEVKQAENKVRKVIVRTVVGGLAVILFNFVIWAGHSWTVLWVLVLQYGCFRELIRVGMESRFERRLPGFMALQWAWFGLAAWHVYSSWLCSIMGDERIDTSALPSPLSFLLDHYAMMSIILYSAVFMASVLALQPPQETYFYQMRRLSFTIMSLLMIFGQMQNVMDLIYKGLIWYFVPSSIVVTNDIMAYFTGVGVGRIFVDRPLLAISPNKTWEGFLGAIIWTVGFAFFFTGHVSSFRWMVCPAEKLTWTIHSPIDCEPHHIFRPYPASAIPDFWPADLLGPIRPIQLHMIAPALFASIVGPFGGFVASGIKRAYDIKDFASFIPGHGGIMDRMDCQMLTSLFVVVYVQTYIRDI
jgi:phosphatidate cytidylyltransferase